MHVSYDRRTATCNRMIANAQGVFKAGPPTSQQQLSSPAVGPTERLSTPLHNGIFPWSKIVPDKTAHHHTPQSALSRTSRNVSIDRALPHALP